MPKLIVLISLLLAGCSLGPQFAPPDMELPEQWISNPACADLQETPVEEMVQWWEALEDSTLNTLMARAVCQNLDLNIAETRIWEARLAQKGALASSLPHLDGSFSYSYLNFNQRTLNNLLGNHCCTKGSHQRNLNIFEAGFDAEWEIDLFGMRAHQNRALDAETESSIAAFANVWVTLSAEIARSYIELRGLQQRLQWINREITSQQEVVELTNSLAVSGLTGSIEQKKADEELNLLLSQKPQWEFAIQKSIYHLSILLGEYPGELLCELSTPEPLPQLPCYRPVGIPSELLRRRPDIRQAERDLEAATESVAAAIAALFPRLSLTGFFGEIATFCSQGSITSFLSPQLLFPIFNSKMLKEDVCANEIKAKRALLQYQKTVLEALEETENAIAAFHHELERHEYLKNMRESSREAYLLSLQLYQTGFINYMEVQTNHRSYLAAETAFLQSQEDLLVKYIALYKALGGGWECLDS